jgi:hypothetical protein
LEVNVFPELHVLTALLRAARTRLAVLRARPRADREAGYTTEAVIATAVLAALALTVLGVIVQRVTAKANGINLN